MSTDRKEYHRQRYLLNREKILAERKKYYEENREDVIEYQKDYQKDYQKNYKKANKEKIKTYQKEYLQKLKIEQPEKYAEIKKRIAISSAKIHKRQRAITLLVTKLYNDGALGIPEKYREEFDKLINNDETLEQEENSDDSDQSDEN